jgi:hypothetical protein
MHENQGNAVTFFFHYTEGGVSKTGLTVTIDVYEVTRDGTATLVTNDGSCTEIGAGLYRYILAGASVDAAAEYVGVAHTATDTVDCQDIPAIWVIDRAGLEKLDSGVPVASIATDALTATAVKADAVTKIQNGLALEATLTAIKGATWSDETLVAINTALEAIDTSGVATAVWAAAVRTLTQSAASVTATVTGSTITAQRGDSLSISLTDVGALTGYSKVYFTVKRDTADADTASIIQIEKTAGLKYLNGAAGTPANGSLTIVDEASGDITIALDEVETAKLDPGVYSYDVQVVRTAGSVSTLTAGTFEVAADVTRATA